MPEETQVKSLLHGLTKALDDLIEERNAVVRKKEELDRKINGLQQSLQGLALYANASEDPSNLTKLISKASAEYSILTNSTLTDYMMLPKSLAESCRTILSDHKGWLTVRDIRERLHASGFDFSNYTSNPLSSIHTTLKRLAASGDIEVEQREGVTYYQAKQESVPHKFEPPPVGRYRSSRAADFEKKKM